MPSHIPWNEELETLLLHCVVVKGAHICGGKKVTQSWNGVNDMFFEQEQLQELKATHYKEGHIRKLRDKYNAVREAVKKDIECGNQSGKEGEQSELYRLVKQVEDDITEKDTEKEAGVALKQKLNDTELRVLEKMGPGKKKMIDGEVIDITKKKRSSKSMSFDDRLFSLFGEPEKSSKQKLEHEMYSVEDAFEINFKEWLQGKRANQSPKKNLLDLFLLAEIDADHQSSIEAIGLKTLVSIYCTRDKMFSAREFKDSLREMDVPAVACHKIFCALQEWRFEFCKSKASNKDAADETSTEPSIDSITVSSDMTTDDSTSNNRNTQP